ncbi:MAG TPA: SsrA-binding protein SmpB [Pirellulales bacterium]|nr:SsrA-binding protein SmpB [Pirellulales bacterium]
MAGSSRSAVSRERRHPTAKSGKKKKEAPDREHDNERLIAQNRRARHEYEVLDTLECGIVLVGSEVKSLRAGTLSLDEAYGRVKAGEVWLMGCDIAEYVQSHQFNHVPRRPRKLLMHRREIKKFAGQAFEKGLTLVPLKMYFKEGRAKVLLGICRGRKLYDKREHLKKKSMKRDIDRAMRNR